MKNNQDLQQCTFEKTVQEERVNPLCKCSSVVMLPAVSLNSTIIQLFNVVSGPTAENEQQILESVKSSFC